METPEGQEQQNEAGHERLAKYGEDWLQEKSKRARASSLWA